MQQTEESKLLKCNSEILKSNQGLVLHVHCFIVLSMLSHVMNCY